MYISYVRPLIEYSDSVWDNCSTESKNQLESIHIEAASVITGATKLCSIEKLFADLGWESLLKRHNKHKLVIFYKILHGIAPTYLSDIVPPLIQDTTTYNLRNAGNIQNYRVHTNLFSNFFFPSTVRAWNDLPNEIKDAPSVGSFKYKINKNLRSPPKFYNAGTRKSQILHARLRMECSSLNSDLHRKTLYLAHSVGVVSLRVVIISFLLARFIYSIDSDISQPILIILLAMTFCLDAKINQMNLTNPFS